MRFRAFLCAGLALLLASGAAAQDSRYGPIGGDTPSMSKELRSLIDEAERARAADPRFLRDLRDLADRYDRPPMVDVISDSFADGDFTRNPTWRVTAGRFRVEPGYGLRRDASAAPSPSTGGSGEDAAKQLFGAILQQALRGQQQSSGAAPATVADRAAIHVARQFANGFAIRVAFSSWQADGAFEVGPFANGDPETGYRVVYQPGASPGLRLVGVSRFGTSAIGASSGPLGLEDRRVHVLEWARSPFGAMTVRLDGETLIQADDRALLGPFDGLAIVQRGGDIIVKSVSVQSR